MPEMLDTELCALSYCATGFAFFASFFVLRQGLNQLLRLVLNYSVIQEGLFLLQLPSSCAGYHMLDTGNTEILLIHLTTALHFTD